jgi:hypothetical protein
VPRRESCDRTPNDATELQHRITVALPGGASACTNNGCVLAMHGINRAPCRWRVSHRTERRDRTTRLRRAQRAPNGTSACCCSVIVLLRPWQVSVVDFDPRWIAARDESVDNVVERDAGERGGVE